MQKEKKEDVAKRGAAHLVAKKNVNKTTQIREEGRAAFFERTLINKGALGPARETLTHTRGGGEENN